METRKIAAMEESGSYKQADSVSTSSVYTDGQKNSEPVDPWLALAANEEQGGENPPDSS